MSKMMFKALLLMPALLGAMFASSGAIAAESTVADLTTEATNQTGVQSIGLTEIEPTVTLPEFEEGAMLYETAKPNAQAITPELATEGLSAPSSTDVASLDQILEYGSENQGTGGLAQVTSVTEFSDVSPDDWAYEALSFLANSETEGGLDCLEGYPDGTFKGGRAMTRYEFAAGLASCLDALTGRLSSLDPDALARIEALQQEFAAELATLKGRVDALEAAVTELQENQFSTTTKLFGETIFSIADIFGDAVDDANNTVFQARVRLSFNTSFTGEDLLNTRLQYSNIEFFNAGENDAFPTSLSDGSVVPMVGFPDPYTRETSLYYQFGTSPVIVNRLFYAFPVGALRVTLGATGTGISDIVSTISPIDAGGYGSISFLSYNPIYDAGSTGTGLGLTYDFNDSLQLAAGYLTGVGSDPSPGFGLFNGGYSLFGQLTYRPGDLSIGLMYLNAYTNFESSFLPAAVSNQYGITINYALTDAINIGGWFNYEDGILIDSADYRSVAYAGYLAINDLGGTNNQLILAAGVPPRISDYEIGDTRIGAFIDDAAFSAELSYRINFSDNISLTPGVIWTTDPGNNNSNKDTFLGVLRTTFYF